LNAVIENCLCRPSSLAGGGITPSAYRLSACVCLADAFFNWPAVNFGLQTVYTAVVGYSTDIDFHP